MDWKIVSLFPLVMWAFYAVLASLSSNTHGEKVNMSLEAMGMVAVAVVVLLIGGLGDFQKSTKLSLTQGSIMAILSAGGLLLQFYAFRIAPPDKQGAVVMITCMFPVLAGLIFHVMAKLGFEGGAVASPRQWLAIATAALTLWLATGK